MMTGATAVITNFFHGCVFSLLNGKPWASVPSDYRSIKIPDLATTLGAKHRILDKQTSAKMFERLMETPIEPTVEKRIGELRNRSEAYLDAALA